MSAEVTTQALLVTSWQEGVSLSFQGQFGKERLKKKEKEELLTRNIKVLHTREKKREKCQKKEKKKQEKLKKIFRLLA